MSAADPFFIQPRLRVLTSVERELYRQDELWGEQNHPDGTGDWAAISAEIYRRDTETAAKGGYITYRHILLEEVYEAMAESDRNKLKTELIQVAAVAVAWVEKLIREEQKEVTHGN